MPDAELLAQVRVERLQEGLAEVLHGVALLKGAEEAGAIDAVQGLGGTEPTRRATSYVSPRVTSRIGAGRVMSESANPGQTIAPDPVRPSSQRAVRVQAVVPRSTIECRPAPSPDVTFGCKRVASGLQSGAGGILGNRQNPCIYA